MIYERDDQEKEYVAGSRSYSTSPSNILRQISKGADRGSDKDVCKVIFLLAEEREKDKKSTNASSAATKATAILGTSIQDTRYSMLDTQYSILQPNTGLLAERKSSRSDTRLNKRILACSIPRRKKDQSPKTALYSNPIRRVSISGQPTQPHASEQNNETETKKANLHPFTPRSFRFWWI